MILIWVLFVQTCMQYFSCNALLKDFEVLPASKKFGLLSNGNCTRLPVDLYCMKFRHGLNFLKKQTCMPKQNNVGAQPVHRKILSKHKLFCYGFNKTHGKFGCDLQNHLKNKI